MDPSILSVEEVVQQQIQYPIDEIQIKKQRELLMNKLVFSFLVLSETIYFTYLIKCIIRFKKTKDLKFFFPLTASLFALSNNFNDIMNTIVAPIKNSQNCSKSFLTIFRYTAMFNWTPISFLQIIRLYQLTSGYYTPRWHRIITVGSVSLSILYCTCYYINLSGFSASKNSFFGCTVYNKFDSFMVEISDTLDSSYSLAIIIISIRKALLNLKEYKLRHQKLKALKDESTIIFIILTISKIVIYSFIMANKKNPGGDIWWDSLSVIVIFCSYRIVNFKPKLNEKLAKNNRIMLNKRLNYMNMRNANNNPNIVRNIIYDDASTSTTKNIDLYDRGSQSKSEISNIPNIINKNDILNKNTNQPKNNYYNKFIGQIEVPSMNNTTNNCNFSGESPPTSGIDIDVNTMNFNRNDNIKYLNRTSIKDIYNRHQHQ
ncbi:hypothetical protein BCR36DRAFT_363770 [Piromyces finnis]|uniref:G-protein coupled receptors family 1 profile domain-containing protein n=1 Tax=Piromyces finnis TaxID=1754191 RepID=A0A1Y1UUK4_9FUNG|nr:hypothetical protein BCR36DRAFT_363770 [Piromyces finnis]|eukprot:ORX41688.1 hypothetical protein BCR36DRAFT_363770 [Piromyces finnis]